MLCTVCQKESRWLEIIGADFVCHNCIKRNKLMSYILKTHADTFRFIIKALKIKDYKEFLKITKEDIDKVTDLKKYGINIK